MISLTFLLFSSLVTNVIVHSLQDRSEKFGSIQKTQKTYESGQIGMACGKMCVLSMRIID